MTDIMLAKAHMGEYSQLNGYNDATGCGDGVIVDHTDGWAIDFADSSDVINERMRIY